MKNSFLFSIQKTFIDDRYGSQLSEQEWAALGRLVERLFLTQNPKVLPAIVTETLENTDLDEFDLSDEFWDSAPVGASLPQFECHPDRFSIFHTRSELELLAGRNVEDREWYALAVALNDLYVVFFTGDGINGLMWGIQGEINGVYEALQNLGEEPS